MELHFETYGEGPPLVILHGLLGSAHNWRHMNRHTFARSFSVFGLDQRNHGNSPHAEEFDYPTLVSDLIEFLDAHHLERAHILGHSMGGKVGMYAALRHPDRIASLVVVDITLRATESILQPVLDALLALDLAGVQERQTLDDALAPSIPDPQLRAFLLKNLKRNPNQSLSWQTNIQSIATNLSAMNVPAIDGQAFIGPTLFVRGSESDYIRDSDTETILRHFPKAQIATIDGAGHWVHHDAPEPFAQTVTDFLART